MTTRWIAAAAVALIGGALAVPMILSGRNGSDQQVEPAGGSVSGCQSDKKADYNFTLKDMDGRDVRLADYKGKVLLLNFWGTWCAPCRAEIPDLMKLVDAHKNRGFEVLGLAQQDTAEDLRAFAADFKMNYPSLLSTEEIEEAFGPMWAVPMSILIDRHGSICMKHMGQIKKEQLDKAIKPLL
jgi:peroxiredoxin